MRTVDVDLGNGKTATLTKPERGDFDGNLGGAVQFALASVIIWIAETSGQALGSFGGSALVTFLEHIEPGLVKYYAPAIDAILEIPEIPGWFRTFLTDLRSPTSEAGAAVLNSVLGAGVAGVTGSLLGTLLAPLTFGANDLIRPARPGVVDAFMMWWRGKIDDATFDDWLADQGWPVLAMEAFKETIRPRIPPGELVTWAWRVAMDPTAATEELGKRGYDDTEIERIITLSRNLLSVPDLLNWSWRENLDPTAVRDEIKKLGYTDDDADRFIELSRNRLSVNDIIMHAFRTTGDPTTAREDIIKQGYPPDVADQYLELAKFIAPVQDLIRMAVREAFSPEIAAKFGQYEDFPPAFAEWAIKQGMTQEWAEAYWAAHWDLPSISMGFEMLHRNIISDDELKLLLRALDVMPFWRDRLVQMSYNPFTRVDVRRMHKLGVLDDADLITAYKDIGYDDVKAAQLAEFTIRLNSQEETEFTVSNVLSGYNAGMLTIQEAYDLLLDMGKSEEYALYILAVEDYKREKALLTEKVNYVKTLYVNWEIDRGEAHAMLGALNLEAERTERFLDTWDVSRKGKVTQPTISQIEEWYKDGILSEAVARIEIGKRKYQDYVIEWMIADWDEQIVVAAQKAVEAAEKEQERITRAAVKEKRDIAIANLNLQIAQIKLYIADIKVAIYQAVSDAQKALLKGTILQLQAEIANLQLEKARQYVAA